MTDRNYEPSVELCLKLIDAALFIGDSKVPTVIMPWFLDAFKVKLSHGIITRTLQTAGSTGDGALAQTALKLLEKNGYNIGYSDYLCLAHASLGGDEPDVGGAIDAIVFAQQFSDIDMLSHSNEQLNEGLQGSSMAGIALQEKLSEKLSRSVRRLDEAYYGLVDLLRRSDGTKVCIHIYIYKYIYMCIYVYTFMYTYI
jgi:hypothetical protein